MPVAAYSRDWYRQRNRYCPRRAVFHHMPPGSNVPVKSKPDKLCSECNQGLIIFDGRRGEWRCENCGAVIEDRLVRSDDAPGQLSPGAKPGGFTRKFDKDHTGKRVKAPWGIERQDSNERAENEIRDIVVRICDVAQPPDKD